MESKFENLVEQYEKYLVGESGFPPLSNLNAPAGGSTATGPTSAVDDELSKDPAVQTAKKAALTKMANAVGQPH